MMISLYFRHLFFVLLVWFLPSRAFPAPADVHFIYFGGSDCPPCVAWRSEELPKLAQTNTFKAIKFTIVDKKISSPVPAAELLPAEIRMYKDKLDFASGGNRGSPQIAILVDGQVIDYYWGIRSADDVEAMLESLLNRKTYTYPACIRYDKGSWRCAQRSSSN
jgi:hypothetical protein